MMLTWRILMLTLRILMLTLRKLICKDTDANILLVTQQTFLIFQDAFKTSWRRLQRDTFCLPWPLLKTSSRRLQDVFAIRLPKTSSRRVCKTSCNYVFKTSCKTKKCYSEDVLKMSWRRLQYVFTKTNVCWVTFADFTIKSCTICVSLLICSKNSFPSSTDSDICINVYDKSSCNFFVNSPL